MLLSPRKNGLDSLFEEVRVFKVFANATAIAKRCSAGRGVLVAPLSRG